MRLIKRAEDGALRLLEYDDSDLPRYAILSHTWGSKGEEVTFRDFVEGTYQGKAGFQKIVFCNEQAARDGLQHFWIDTCCIDKSSSTELNEAINSMYDWYRKASKCYVYLSDVSTSTPATGEQPRSNAWEESFQKSRWHTRGWTLQELIAPSSVEFFSREGTKVGSKMSLEYQIHEITGIPLEALRGAPLTGFPFEERWSWAQHRETKRAEDKAYSLCGLFGIRMSLFYGEGRDSALNRLHRKVQKHLNTALDAHNSVPTSSGKSIIPANTSVGSNEYLCTKWCSCRCHRVRILGSPQLLTSTVGSFSVRCGAERPGCNETSCKRRVTNTTVVTYRFPKWLANSAIRFSLTSSALSTLSNITTYRIIPDSADIFGAVSAGDLSEMQRLFKEGKASIYDVDEHNWTLLHRAYLVGREEICRFLLTQGVDAFVEADNGRAWNHAHDTAEHLTENVIFRNYVLAQVDIDEFVQSQQYTVLHKIVLGVSKLQLSNYLEASTQDINEPDARGYSPLYWASTTGNEAAVRTLLSYGADPDAAGRIKHAPLHVARTTQIVRSLLEYKAHVDARDTPGRTPLHCYCYRQTTTSPLMAELLLGSGANVNAKSAAGHTPLHYAAAYGKTHLMAVLLKHGASINDIKNSGDTALLLAVRHNQIDAIKMLLERSADVRLRNKQLQNVLHIGACFGRVEILELLSTSDLADLLPSDRDQKGKSAFDYFESRQDRSSELETAFARLTASFPAAASEDGEMV